MDVSLVLNLLVVETIVDTQGDEIDLFTLDTTTCNSLVLCLDVVGKLRTVVTTITLSEDTKVATFVLRELSQECLEEFPNERSCELLLDNALASSAPFRTIGQVWATTDLQ